MEQRVSFTLWLLYLSPSSPADSLLVAQGFGMCRRRQVLYKAHEAEFEALTAEVMDTSSSGIPA
jgi:hypothetical protein